MASARRGNAPPPVVPQPPPLLGGAELDVTVTVAVAVALAESVTRTTSVTPPVLPAVYAPAAVMVPPELLVAMAQLYPVPLPPEAVKVCIAPGANVTLEGAMASDVAAAV